MTYISSEKRTVDQFNDVELDPDRLRSYRKLLKAQADLANIKNQKAQIVVLSDEYTYEGILQSAELKVNEVRAPIFLKVVVNNERA